MGFSNIIRLGLQVLIKKVNVFIFFILSKSKNIYAWNAEISERKERCRFFVEHGNIIERGNKYKNKKLLVLQYKL